MTSATGLHLDRCEHGFNRLALRIQPGGQGEPLPQRLAWLVDQEAGVVGSDLQDGPIRIVEVYRAEVAPVEDRCQADAKRQETLAPGLLRCIVLDLEGEVVRQAAPDPAPPHFPRWVAEVGNDAARMAVRRGEVVVRRLGI